MSSVRLRCRAFVRTTLLPTLFATAVWFVALEIVARVAISYDPDLVEPRTRGAADAYPDSAEWVDDYFAEYRDANVMRWEPYVYWRRKAFDGRYINVDSLGFRSTWTGDQLAGDSTFLVFLFGGSTMWGTGARDDYTIASHLARLLSGHSNGSVRVVNYGENGYVSTQELIALQRALANGSVPDLAIFYDGVNDVYSAFQERDAGIPKNESRRRAEFNLGNVHTDRTGDAVRLTFNHLVADLALVLLAERVYNEIVGHESRRNRWAEWIPEEEVDELARGVVDNYASAVRQITALSEEYDFETLFYWQPVIFTKKRLTDYEIGEKEKKEYVEPIYHATRRHIAESRPLAHHENFADISNIFDAVEEPIYIDFCHLAEKGNRMIAEIMARDALSLAGTANEEAFRVRHASLE